MASPSKYGSEFLINTTTAGWQDESSITALADGRFVVSWTDWSATGGDDDNAAIRAQIFNGDGSMSGAEFLVNTATRFGQSDPSITGLSDGRFVVSWRDDSLSGGDTWAPAVRAQVFNVDGTKAGVEFLVNTITPYTQYEPSITALENGRFLVTWSDHSEAWWGGDTSQWAVRAQIYDTDGNAWGGEFLVNTSTAAAQFQPSVTTLEEGRFVIAWEDYSNTGGDPTGAAIRAQIFNADGTKSGAELLVNTTTVSAQRTPSITTLEDGRFVVAWMDYSKAGGDPSGTAIRAQVFNADGSRAGGEFLVNTTTAAVQSEPTITGLADGRFVVSWTDESRTGDDTSDWAIRAQVFDADGTKAGEEFLVNTTTSGAQREPSITGLADGRFVVSWTDPSATGDDTSGTAVRGQIFDPREAAVTLTGSALDDDFVGTRFGDTMSGLRGDDLLIGARGNDTLSGAKGKDILRGDGGRDVLKGGDGNDRLFGGKGNDELTGGKGADRLVGGSGRDELFGNAGKDKIIGGKGRDELTGGTGGDTFIFNSAAETGKTAASRDIIRDFSQAQGDVIDLSGIDARSGPGNQAFTFIGDAAFSSSKGELKVTQTATKTIIRGDIDGDGVKDFVIELSGLHTLTAGDFIL